MRTDPDKARPRRTTPSARADGAEAGLVRLVVMNGSQPGRRYVLDGGAVIGRALDCDVVMDDPEASRKHVRVEHASEGDGYRLVDLGSRNGTFLNGERVKGASPIHFGDKIRLGSQTLLLFARHDPTEDQLLHRQRLETLGRLSAGAAHDFNNMLGAVSATASFLRSTPFEEWEEAEVKSCLLDILNATGRAAELAKRLLAFSRTDSRTRAQLDLSELCHELVQLARRTFPRTIQVSSKVEPRLVIDGDRDQLHQALVNLVINARDAILAEGDLGTITVRAYRLSDEDSVEELETHGGTQAIVEIEDDGCGMDSETVERVFEPFYTTKPRGTGFGIGLSSVSEIVLAHGGRVGVKSEVGEGSTFRVVLPGSVFKRAPKKRQRTAASMVSRLHGADRRVLVVDDEAVIRRSVRRVLVRAGFVVHDAEDGERGLQLLEDLEQPPDVLLLDLDLPGMTGEELLPIVRRRDPSLPVLTMSGHALSARGVVASDAHLAKPFEATELLGMIYQLLGDLEGERGGDEVTLT